MIEFGFDDGDFSDRVLRIEIASEESLDSKSDSEGYDSVPNCKRRRVNLDKEILFPILFPIRKGDEAYSNDSDLECLAWVKVKTLHISSPVLAAKSPFFYKLFKNGMRESQENHFTIRINASEEAALMDLLNFIYNYTLTATTIPELLNVLMIADKFEVTSCMRYCNELLLKFPMSLEYAIQFFKLPSSVLMAESIQPLKDVANQYTSELYKLQEQAMALPLSDVEVLLASDDLKVKSEDDVFNFILKWSGAHYPKQEEYRETLNKLSIRFLRFPYLSSSKHKEILDWPHFDRTQVSKLVQEAIFFQAGLPYRERTHDPNVDTEPRFKRRVYEYRPIKVVHFESMLPRCVVYIDLKKEECVSLYPTNRIHSRTFLLGGSSFCLSSQCIKDHQSNSFNFCLYLQTGNWNGVSCLIDYEFAVLMKKPPEEFQSKYKVVYSSLSGGFTVKDRGIPWKDLMADDNNNEYFIDGILHLRAEVTLKRS